MFHLLLHPHHLKEYRRCSINTCGIAHRHTNTHTDVNPHSHVTPPQEPPRNIPTLKLPQAHAHPHLPPPTASQARPPQLPLPALPKAFTNCFLEILRRLWCSFSLTQETTQQFCFSKSGTHKPGILSSFFSLEFSLAGCLSPGRWPGGHTQSALCWAPSSRPSGQLQRGKGHNCFTDGETESGGGTGERLGGVGSFQVCANVHYY